MIIAEIIGYIASLLIALSLTMKNIIKLRLINLIGAISFAIYGLAIKAYPVFMVNLFITIINVFYLYELLRRKNLFHLQEMRKGSQFVQMFVDFYQKDLNLFFPNLQKEHILSNSNTRSIILFRNLISVGLFIYEIDDSKVFIHVDYVTKEYRDLKNAQFLFNRMDEIFKGKPVKSLVTRSYHFPHTNYLRKMGFKAIPDDPGMYVMELDDYNNKHEK